MTKFLKNRRNQIPPFRINNQTLLTSQEKSNALADTFAQNNENPLASTNVIHTKLSTRKPFS